MSSSDSIRSTLESMIQAQFPTLMPGVPVMFLNTKFVTPDQPWIHVAVLPNLSGRANIGPQQEFKALGIVNVTCMVPENTGTAVLRRIADAVETVLIDRTIANPGMPGGVITLYGQTTIDRGVLNGFYAINVKVSYRAKYALIRS